MDWNIFWSAFGAIGTTIGSLITAIAVVVAVKQYKQPLEKQIKVRMTSAVSSDMAGNSLFFYCVSIQNRGIRTIEVNSINIYGKKKILWLNNAQYESNAYISLPCKIEPEQNKDFLFEVENFRKEIKRAVDNKAIKPSSVLTIFVTDSLGDKYYCKTKIKIKNLIKNI